MNNAAFIYQPTDPLAEGATHDDKSTLPSSEKIAARAYEMLVQDGERHERYLEYWQQAKRELGDN
jgi:hypothetical protein